MTDFFIGKICQKHPQLGGKRRVIGRCCPKCTSDYKRNRRKVDVPFKLKRLTAARIRKAVRRGLTKKSANTKDLLGCTFEYLKEYLAAKFQPGMSWENWSNSTWHIDHIKPMTAFDLADPEQQRTCCHYTNLQPLWAAENIRKGKKY